MIRILAAVILLLPVVEIAGFVVIGGRIGLGATLLWVLAAAIGGIALIRQAGVNAVTKLQAAVAVGREPGHSLIDGAAMVIAGLLLVVPGFFSDFLALILLLPWTRHFLLRQAARHFETRVYRGQGREGQGQKGGRAGATIIEGEFEVVAPAGEEPDTAATARPSRDNWRQPPQIIDQSEDQK